MAEWNKNAIFRRWHIMQNKKTGECGYYYYDEDDFDESMWKDEFGEERDDYDEIPCEEWSPVQIAEVLANCMEDCNMHRALYWPKLILASISELDNGIQKKIMQKVMDEMLANHLY